MIVGVCERVIGMDGSKLHTDKQLVCLSGLHFENSLPRTKKDAAENFSLAKLVNAGRRGSLIPMMSVLELAAIVIYFLGIVLVGIYFAIIS